MQKITTFLTYDDQAEEAVKLYTSIFKNSKITETSRYAEGGPGTPGQVMTMAFQLEGQNFVALNGGPSFSFAEGISLYVSCEDQAEIDRLWEKLTANGGKPGRCGWLTDRFGVAWQIIPRALTEYIGGSDQAGAARALQAMLAMNKLDIAELRRAYEGQPAKAGR
jgi:predicted 3-demethylubiquinone-9 3-methyltransferase (glyoxalase superfamily)